MKRILRRWIKAVRPAGAILLALILVSCSAIGTGRVTSRMPVPGYTVVPLARDRNNQLLLRAEINGKLAVFLVDTGAPHMCIDESKAPAYGLQPVAGSIRVLANGKLHSVAAVPSLSFGAVAFENASAILADLASVAQAGRPSEPQSVDGIIGLDTLMALNAVIDCAKPEMLVRPDRVEAATVSSSMAASGLAAAPLYLQQEHLFVDATVNTIPTKFIVDTGAAGTVLDPKFANRCGLKLSEKTYPTAAINFTDAAGRTVMLTRLTIGGHPVDITPALVFRLASLFKISGADRLPDETGLLGMQTLASTGAVIDCRNRRIYLRKRAPLITVSVSGIR